MHKDEGIARLRPGHRLHRSRPRIHFAYFRVLICESVESLDQIGFCYRKFKAARRSACTYWSLEGLTSDDFTSEILHVKPITAYDASIRVLDQRIRIIRNE